MENQKFNDCINTAVVCAQICNYCATSSLSEENARRLANCIQLDPEYAAIYRGVVEATSLGSSFFVAESAQMPLTHASCSVILLTYRLLSNIKFRIYLVS